MATPPPPSSSASDPVAAAPIIAGVNPSKPYPQIFSPTAAASGAEPLIGKPLNPPPPGPPSQAVVFSIPRGIPFRPRPPIADQTVTVAGSAGYVRGAGQQTPLVAFATGQGRGPFMFPADQTGQRPPPASAVHMMRPPQPQAPFVIPRQARSAAPGAAATGAPKSAPINAGPPKVFLSSSDVIKNCFLVFGQMMKTGRIGKFKKIYKWIFFCAFPLFEFSCFSSV